MGKYETARDFWCSKTEYPSYSFVKRRRFHEVSHMLSRLSDLGVVDKFCDIGCGDGSLVRCLDTLMEVGEFFCCDFSSGLLAGVPKTNRFRTALIDLNDRASHASIEPGTVVNLGGCLNYVFDDDVLVDLLRSLVFDRMFIRAVCSCEGDQMVETYSSRLGSMYSCLYRTKDRTEDLIKKSGVKVLESFRAFPDNIESEFGTKQYMFYCVRH